MCFRPNSLQPALCKTYYWEENRGITKKLLVSPLKYWCSYVWLTAPRTLSFTHKSQFNWSTLQPGGTHISGFAPIRAHQWWISSISLRVWFGGGFPIRKHVYYYLTTGNKYQQQIGSRQLGTYNHFLEKAWFDKKNSIGSKRDMYILSLRGFHTLLAIIGAYIRTNLIRQFRLIWSVSGGTLVVHTIYYTDEL